MSGHALDVYASRVTFTDHRPAVMKAIVLNISVDEASKVEDVRGDRERCG
jgi:hypothetical protein